MKFCNKCVTDSEWGPIIKGLGQRETKCPLCHCRDVYVYDTDANVELIEGLEGLLDIYTPTSALPPNYPTLKRKLLSDELRDRWHIFSDKLSSTDVYNIVCSVCSEKYADKASLFDSPVGLAETMEPDYMKDHSLLRGHTWEKIIESIRNKNRFHTGIVNLQILESYCSFIRKVYKKGSVLYRGRVSSEMGFPITEMGAPPADRATAGRANAEGIQCLYLASDIDTTLQEVRAGAFDYVSVGKFELMEDIVVVDLKAIDHISPFIAELNPLDHAINKEYLNKMNYEIGRVLRRSDSVLDYLPTQYIVDFIKSIEHDENPEYAGVVYNSTLNRRGENIAVFYPDLFQCTGAEVFHISELLFKKEKV